MKDLIEVLEKVTELLYQENYNDAYGILIKCLPIMGVYIGEIEDENLQREIMNALNEAISAMENNDYTLLADILQYDFIDKLKDLGDE